MARPKRNAPRIPICLNMDPLDPRDREVLEMALELAKMSRVHKDGEPYLRFGIEELLRDAVALRRLLSLGANPLVPGAVNVTAPGVAVVSSPAPAVGGGVELESMMEAIRERGGRPHKPRKASAEKRSQDVPAQESGVEPVAAPIENRHEVLAGIPAADTLPEELGFDEFKAPPAVAQPAPHYPERAVPEPAAVPQQSASSIHAFERPASVAAQAPREPVVPPIDTPAVPPSSQARRPSACALLGLGVPTKG